MAEKILRTICQSCHTNCGLIVHLNADAILSIEGDPDHPMNRGRVCSKASVIPDIINSKDRLRVPLQKTSTGFKEISWDDALKFAAEKLADIRSKFGPLSLTRCGGAPVSYQCRDGFMQFMGEFGSPNMTGAANLCMVPRMTAFREVTGGMRAEPDYESTRLVLFWGTNPSSSERFGAYTAYNGMRQIFSRLKQRGIRTICIDPFRTRTVQQTDAWVPINPGTDVALGLAMIHVIIGEGLYDKDFVLKYTNGFEELARHARPFTPKWAEPITGVPAESIQDLARIYGTTKPATIYEGNGLDMYVNGVDAVRTVAILISLTGNLDGPGGNVFLPFTPQSSLPTRAVPMEKRMGHETFPLFGEVPFPAVKEALLKETADRPRAMIVHHSNPVLVQANEKRTRQALEKLDFMIVNEIFPTATSEMADLILPMASDFESYGYRAYSSVEGAFMAMARPIVAPVGQARPVFDVEAELAERMGFHQNYPFSDDASWVTFMIEPSGVTFERLDAEQIVMTTPPVQYRKYEKQGFPTPSGKVEFSSKRFLDSGYDPIPSYGRPADEPLSSGADSEKGTLLVGTSRRPAQFVHTKFKNFETLNRTYPGPLAWINPLDAADRSINDGDEVDVNSAQGTITLRAKLTEDTRPGLLWIDFGWGNPTDKKANINILVNDAVFDPVSGGTPNRRFLCEIKKKRSS